MINNLRHDPYVIDPKLSAMQSFRKLPEGVLAEVINDKLYVSPSPTTYHQEVSSLIMGQLASYVRRNNLGKVFSAPTDVYLTRGTSVVIPDIIFIAHKSKAVIAEKGVLGPPDFVIEVLSPSTRKRDLTIKKNLYQKAGVREYWLVDPISKDTWGYLLKNGAFGEPLILKSKIHVRILKKTFGF